MEELRSTEILDREIQDDARRKAEKILKVSEAECAQILAETRKRIESTEEVKAVEYNQLLEAYIHDAESAVPLEKQRRRVSFVDKSVHEALDIWLEGLSLDRRFTLYSHILAVYQPVLRGKKLNILFKGCTAKLAASLVSRALPESSSGGCTLVLDTDQDVSFFSEGLLVVTEDRSMICRATREELLSDLMTNKRQELSEALLGGRMPS